MSTLCNDVQAIVSAAYDGATTDREAIIAAKAHCATCPDCAEFVSFLGSIRGIAPPDAPEDAITRTLARVHAEAAAIEATAEADQVAAAARERIEEVVAESAAASAVEPTAEPAAVEPVVLRRPDWRATTPWIAAAAVLLVGAVLVTAQGVRYIMSPAQPPGQTFEVSALPEFATEDTWQTEPGEKGGYSSGGDAAGDYALRGSPGAAGADASLDSMAATSPGLAAYVGTAYRMAGVAEAPDGPPSGSLVSALDSGTLPVPRDVWEGQTPRSIVVDAGEGRFLQLQRVERSLAGRTFALTADRIDSFDAPAGLPSAIPQPTEPNGWPTFVPGGTDDSGQAVYVRPGTDRTAGFALAPGAEGPEWTWWLPVQ